MIDFFNNVSAPLNFHDTYPERIGTVVLKLSNFERGVDAIGILSKVCLKQ